MHSDPLSPMTIDGLAVTHGLPIQRTHELPILFVHGAWGGKWQFENWQRYAAERGWESYALDLRGHNESPCDDLRKVSLDDYADDVMRMVREIGPCYLLGHSMGGKAVQIVASRSNNVKKLVLLASVPRGAIFVNAYLLRMSTYVPRALCSGTIVPEQRDIRRFFGRIPPEAVARFVPESTRSAIGIVGAALGKSGKVPCPALVVAGANDQLIPVSIQKKLARSFAAAYEEFPSGHFLMLEENWREPIERILRWLQK